MWVPKIVVNWFGLNAEMIREIQSELAVVRAERDTLKLDLMRERNNQDWLRMRLNGVEVEKAALMEKLFGLKIPVPELQVKRKDYSNPDMREFSFDDVGDEMAKKLGLPVYGEN